MQLDSKALAYAGTSLANGMMSAVFNFYYVKIFLNYYHVSEGWFQTSQIIFMVWNAINDPLFGYIQDNMSFSWVKSRRHSILYGAPFFAMSFLIPWFPWGDYNTSQWLAGVHLLVALCIWDTLFTFVLLAQCALFAEISVRHKDRLTLVRYSQVASLIGSSSVYFCELFSRNLNNFFMFQMTCVVIGILAYLSMRYSGNNCHTEYDLLKAETEENPKPSLPEPTSVSLATMWKQTLQIFQQRSFVSFVLMNFCQIYQMTFLSNFTAIFHENMLGKEYMSTNMRSAYYGLMSVIPQLLVIIATPCVGTCGYFTTIRASFIIKILLASVLYFIGPNAICLTAYLLLDSMLCSATFSLFNLCLSDVIDVDIQTHNRRHPLSSMVFGTNALITKPAISLAPMITVYILNQHGYENLRNEVGPTVDPGDLHDSMFNILCTTSFTIGALQLAIWSRYTIRDSHITEAKYIET